MNHYFTAVWRDADENLYAARSDGKVFFRTEGGGAEGYAEDYGSWKHDPSWDCPQGEAFEEVERVEDEEANVVEDDDEHTGFADETEDV